MAALQDCEPHLLIVDRQFVSSAGALSGAAGRRIIYMDDGEAPEGFSDFEGMIAHFPAMDDNSSGGGALAGDSHQLKVAPRSPIAPWP